MERSKSFLAGLVALCFLAGHAFVHGRFGPMAKPAEAAHEAGDAPQFSHLFSGTTWLWCGTQALSAGAALGLVLALTQAPVRADDMSLMDLESQVTVARIDKEQKKKELQADGLAVSQYTKEKVRTGEDKLREFTRDASLEFASTERSLRAGPGVRSVKRKSLQKEPSQGVSFAGVGALASLLPPLPSLPSLPLPSLPSGGPPSVGEDAALPLISGAAVSLALPAVVVAGAVNSRISEKKREDAERKARERADPTGSILTIAAGVGAAAILGNAILTSLPQGKEATKAPPVVTAAKPSADDGAAKKAAEDKAAAESKAAAEKAAADKAEADKAAAEKAAAEKKAAEDKGAAESKAAADKAAADKAAADKAAADKAAADKAEADKAAADKAEADKKAAESKAAADRAAADKAAAEKAAADQAAAEKAAAEKKAAEAPKAEESKQAKIAKKGGYFAYMKAKQQG